jgi:ribulose 1,5-bisphosphate synthetase/thiazole synthase
MGAIEESVKFDVIVIGSGISGGWAAKEFCEKGFKNQKSPIDIFNELLTPPPPPP